MSNDRQNNYCHVNDVVQNENWIVLDRKIHAPSSPSTRMERACLDANVGSCSNDWDITVFIVLCDSIG